MAIKENIKKLRDKFGLTQQDLAEIAGVTNKAVSAWESGLSEPRMGAIERISQKFGIKKSNLIEENGMDNLHLDIPKEATKTVGRSTEVPLYGSIAAGVPLEMLAIEEYVEIPKNLADRYPGAFLLRVNGDSMNKIVPNGVYALIDPTEEIKSGDIAAVAVNGYDATLKRFFKLQNAVALEPDSYDPKYEAKLYNHEEASTLKVIGKMVWFMSPVNFKY